jgi:thiol-disulfide isomerase/thioredoxin
LPKYFLPLSGLAIAVVIGIAVFALQPKTDRSDKATTVPAPDGGAVAAAPDAASAGDAVVTGRFQKVASTPDIAGIVISDPQGDVDLGRYKGKTLLINVWATWCPPCVAEMPSLNRLQAKLGSDHFAVVPVAVDEPNMAAVQDFMNKYQLHNLPVLIDMNHAIDHRIRLQSLPASLLVSPEGKILARFTGENRWDCGQPLAAVEAFVKTGEIAADTLPPCEN